MPSPSTSMHVEQSNTLPAVKPRNSASQIDTWTELGTTLLALDQRRLAVAIAAARYFAMNDHNDKIGVGRVEVDGIAAWFGDRVRKAVVRSKAIAEAIWWCLYLCPSFDAYSGSVSCDWPDDLHNIDDLEERARVGGLFAEEYARRAVWTGNQFELQALRDMRSGTTESGESVDLADYAPSLDSPDGDVGWLEQLSNAGRNLAVSGDVAEYMLRFLVAQSDGRAQFNSKLVGRIGMVLWLCERTREEHEKPEAEELPLTVQMSRLRDKLDALPPAAGREARRQLLENLVDDTRAAQATAQTAKRERAGRAARKTRARTSGKRAA